ncbi:MAG: hypothetical protein Q9221_005680 [Calogaya cf. arnoldii]
MTLNILIPASQYAHALALSITGSTSPTASATSTEPSTASSTPKTTASTSPTPTAPSTATGSKPSSCVLAGKFAKLSASLKHGVCKPCDDQDDKRLLRPKQQYNFSTYTTFWDNLLGTTWRDREGAQKRYQRVREMTKIRGPIKKETVSMSRIESVIAGEEGE